MTKQNTDDQYSQNYFIAIGIVGVITLFAFAGLVGPTMKIFMTVLNLILKWGFYVVLIIAVLYLFNKYYLKRKK